MKREYVIKAIMDNGLGKYTRFVYGNGHDLIKELMIIVSKGYTISSVRLVEKSRRYILWG